MGSPEAFAGKEQDPRMGQILEQYGAVLVVNHEGQSQPLSQAVDECPPFVTVLLSAETPEQLQQVVDSLRAPE